MACNVNSDSRYIGIQVYTVPGYTNPLKFCDILSFSIMASKHITVDTQFTGSFGGKSSKTGDGIENQMLNGKSSVN